MQLHPIANEVLQASLKDGYFQSNRFCQAIAERKPEQCVQWSVNLVAPYISQSNPSDDGLHEALTFIRDAMRDCSEDTLAELDQRAWALWSSKSSDATPYLHRSVARLAWATICLICDVRSMQFASAFVGIRLAPDDRNVTVELANQCAMAIDMTITQTDDGRLAVAQSFSREMALLP